MKTDTEIYNDYCIRNKYDNFNIKYMEGFIINTTEYNFYVLRVRVLELFQVIFTPILDWLNKKMKK